MSTPAVNATNHKGYPDIALNFLEPLWYAVYTNANHEKRVAQQLAQRSIEYLLPLYDSVRSWKDRRVRLRVLQIPSVVHLVSFSGHPAPVPESDIQSIQNCLNRGHHLEPYPYLQAGRRVRVSSGPLRGLEGIILRRKNRTRFILSFDLIMRSVAVEIDNIDLVPTR